MSNYGGFDDKWLAELRRVGACKVREPARAPDKPTEPRKPPATDQPTRQAAASKGGEQFAAQLHFLGLPEPVAEYRFHPTRKWRIDFAYPVQMIAIEIDGGVYTKGRHTRGKGFSEDCVKQDEAVLLGWRYFRFTTEQVESGYASQTIQKALEGK